jgi:hypothetical protein
MCNTLSARLPQVSLSLIVALVTGCETSSPVVPAGNDTYMVSLHIPAHRGQGFHGIVNTDSRRT